MKTKTEMFYEVPLVEVIEVNVEKGFATSDGNLENFQEDNVSNW
jgi:hypothetical protein